jgi:hypothetical protein
MEDKNPSKYRERIEDKSKDGLTRKDEIPLRPDLGGITLENIAKGAREDAFEFTPLADQISLLGEDQDETDDLLPDFGIGTLAEGLRSERCSELLEQAHEFISSGQCRQALAPLEEALVATDRRSDEATALKIHCLVDLGHYEAALRIVRMARGHIENPERRAQILRLESRCIREMTREIENQLGKLIKERKLDEAMALIHEGLGRQPSNIILLYHLANLHWIREEGVEAQRVIEEARRHVGRENIDLIAELERKITLGDHRATVEAARIALRKGDVGRAIELLNACRALAENEHYDGLRSYAEEKHRGGLSLLFGSRTASAQGAERQQTLRWLLSEELKAFEEARRAGRFADARKALEAAAKLEPGCIAVAFRHAGVIVEQYRRAFEKKRHIRRDTALKDLALAESLITSIAGDAEYEAAAAALVKSIRALREKAEGL